MRRFLDLYRDLDATQSTRAKIEALGEYFRSAPPGDAAWAVFFLTGNRLKRVVGPSRLRDWGREVAGLPEWLFRESYGAVGDLAETVALLVGGTGDLTPQDDLPLREWVVERLLPLRDLPEPSQRERILAWWVRLPAPFVFLLNKLLTGALRVGVSRGLVARALADVSGIDRAVIQHRLSGRWKPEARSFEALVSEEAPEDDRSRPYPFFLASPLDAEPETLGPLEEWHAEWKWDGIRGQLIHREGEVFLWSRGEELVTERFPEIAEMAARLPGGTVLDGEILAWRNERPLPFAVLQKRIGRKRIGPKILRDAPAAFVAYDLLERESEDVREQPLVERRESLRAVVAATDDPRLRLSPPVRAEGWEELAKLREEARERGVEGLMLKRVSSPYRVGRPRGDWWKWKVDPYTMDAVLIYAQAGHGRRASLFTDYTFAVWDDEGELVPVAKAYSGLDDAEIRELDRWIRRNTRERFGPVRSVEAHHVFELAFEGIRRSTRHKAGVAVRFPRIQRWRREKNPEDADSLATIRVLLPDER